jgi:methylphosphotriester-DNA--protein-cysteine methyltransferase
VNNKASAAGPRSSLRCCSSAATSQASMATFALALGLRLLAHDVATANLDGLLDYVDGSMQQVHA